MTLRAAVIKLHRWLGLAVAALWIVQAATGVVIVFHWEIDDAITPGVHQPTDFHAIEQRIAPLSPHSMWTTAGASDRFDLFVDDGVIRIDGKGNVLRKRLDGEKFAHGGVVDTIVVLHQSLLAGERGRWITGSSGAILLSNIMLGIIAAWPRRGQWLRALRPVRGGARVAHRYSWHRAAGLWIAIPAMCVVTAGVLLAFDEQLEHILHTGQTSPAPITGTARIGLAQAVEIALARYPGAVLSGVSFPSKDNAMWSFTLKQRGELQRAYGKTRVFVSAVDGHIAGSYDALMTAPPQRFVDHLFSFHTGEMGGTVGRLVVLTTGAGLLTVIYYGVTLWWVRRRIS